MSRNGHSTDEAALARADREARLAALCARIAGGRAAPGPSCDRAAFLAMDTDWDEGGRPYRRLYCRWYGRCLEYASGRKWDGFTCRGCVVDEPLDDETRKIENRALTRKGSLLDVGAVADRRRI